jgi:hypothetical protein
MNHVFTPVAPPGSELTPHIVLVSATRCSSLFEWRGLAGTMKDAAAKGTAACESVVRAMVHAHGLDQDVFKQAFVINDVLVGDANGPSRWRASSELERTCAIMSPEGFVGRDPEPVLESLMRNVLYADAGCVAALGVGRKLGVRMGLERPERKCDVVIHGKVELVDHHPPRRNLLTDPDLSEALKILAVHVVVTRRFLPDPDHRWGVQIHHIEHERSATLRAAIIRRGVQPPLRLIAWLDAHGHTALAGRLRERISATPPAAGLSSQLEGQI